MNKEGLIPIGVQFMALHEVIKHFAPPDAAEVQMARHHLKMAYAFIRRAFGEPVDRRAESEDHHG
jgi:hypothetical protein